MNDPIASIRAAVAGRYELGREVGQGAFATVYLARDLRHERRVAFKILNADPDSELSELRFLREIRYLAALQHPNILPLIDSGHAGATLWYVMPYVSGETLRDRMQRERQLPVVDAVSIARSIADALEYAHHNGLVHRDIKPENILLSAGHPIIADFGIARAIDSAGTRQLTQTGSATPGTPAYMSPEQLLSDGTPVDGRADTYSLGCVLYEMLTGKPPFAGKDGFVRRFTAPPPLPSLLRPGLSADLDRVVSTAMARDPDERYQTGGAFCEALATVDPGSPRASGTGERVTPAGPASAVTNVPACPPLVAGVTPSTEWPTESGSVLRPNGGFPPPARRHLLASGAIVALLMSGAIMVRLGRNHLVAGRRALDAGRLHAAVAELRAAAVRDTASASLWLAQSLLLAGEDSTAEWRRAAASAAAGASGLVMADAERAQGLAAMARGQYDRACASFATLHAAAPADPASTFSLAECQARDDRVIRDSASPSGWRFRGDRDAGIRLYQALLEQLPPDHELRRTIYLHLPRMLTLEWGVYRAGRGWPDSSLRFGAFPSLVESNGGGAVAYEPHPLSDFRSNQPWMDPPGMERAWERDRAVLRAAAQSAVTSDPGNADAHRLLARSLELSGEIDVTAPSAASALREIRLARRLVTDRVTSIRLRFDEVRLLVKVEQFGAARALGDSVLVASSSHARETIDEITSLEALLGHARQLAAQSAEGDLERRMLDGRPIQINQALARTTLAFAAYAVSGGPRDSLVSLRDQADRLIRSFSAPQSRDSLRAVLLGRPLSQSVPVLGPEAVAGLLDADALTRAQQALGRGDAGAARAMLDSLRSGRSEHAAATARVDQIYQEAWVRMAIGDTSAAVQQLDDALNGLPALGTFFIRTTSEAAAVGRAMTLRARLARARRDRNTERRWAPAAAALLAGADRELRP